MIKELTTLKNLVDEYPLERLQNFLINSNLDEQEREKLVDIITSMILTKEAVQHFDHLG
jgi:hypothetical protein